MRTKRTTSRLLSVLLCLVMVLGLLPTAAFAEGTGSGTSESDPIVVNNYDDLKKAMTKSTTTYVKLGDDITTASLNGGAGIGKNDIVVVRHDITLNLNGHTLTLTTTVSSVDYFIRVMYGSLTIKDSATNGTIKMEHDNNKVGFYGILVDSALTVESGTIKCENETRKNYGSVIVANARGSVTINGGTISNTEGYTNVGGIDTVSKALWATSESTLTINDGDFYGLVGIYADALSETAKAKKVINGGTFHDGVAITKSNTYNGNVDVAVCGGTFIRGKHYSYFRTLTAVGFYEGKDEDVTAFASMFPDNTTILCDRRIYTNADDDPACVLHGSDDPNVLFRTLLPGESVSGDRRYNSRPRVTVFSGGLSDIKLKAGESTIEANASGFGAGAIAPGSTSQTITVTAAAPDGLRELANNGTVEYTASVWLSKKTSGATDSTYLTNPTDYTLKAEKDANGDPKVTLTLNETPRAGDVYIFTLFLNAKVQDGDDTLTLLHEVSCWTLNVEDVKTPISSVKLNMSEKLMEGATSAPAINASGTGFNTAPSVTWNLDTDGAKAGHVYRATVTLTATDDYVFTSGTELTVDGDVLSDQTSTSLSDNGKKMTIYLSVPARHNHKWEGKYDDAEHWKVCKVCSAEQEDSRGEHDLTGSPDGSGKINVTCSGCDYTYSYNDSSIITEVRIHVVDPTSGKTPSELGGFVENGVSYIKGYTGLFDISNVKWTDNSGANVTTFESGKKYKVSMTLTAKDTKTFADGIAVAQKYNEDGGVKVYPDGHWTDGTNVTATRAADGKTLTVTYTMPSAIKIPAIVDITLPTYAVGDKFSDKLPTVSCETPGALTDDAKVSMLYVYELSNKGLKDIGLYDVKEEKWMGSDGTELAEAPVVKAETLYQIYVLGYTGTDADTYTYTTQISDSGNAVESGFKEVSIFSVPYGNYQFADPGKITSVALTVEAPKYGKIPAATATGADDTRYTVGTPTWSPNGGTFGAGSYTVSIPVTPKDGYSFDENCTYTVNGYAAIYKGGSVDYAFPALTAPHAHDTDTQTWKKLDELQHYRACTSDDDWETANHDITSWTDKNDGQTHAGNCTVCGYEKTENHTWVYDKQLTAPTLTDAGKAQYKCSAKDCGATKTEPIAKLEAISAVNVTVTAPVRGNTPEDASADSTAYYVASTDWTPTISSTFAGGTKYTVKVSLEASGSNRFTDSTTFKINGQTATLVSPTPGADGTDNVSLSYEFPATSSGSSSGGSGGSSSSAYTVTVKDSKNGAVTADRKTATSGATVTLTVKPDQGWTLETLAATNASGKEIDLNIVKVGEKYTFKMPSSNVTVNATFMEDNTILNYFVDVPTDSYYYDAVLWAVDKGITQGTDNSHFNPNGICTRTQAVTFLWRAAGSPAPKTATMPFTDVPAGSYYYDAVLWAVENGITRGTSDTTFSPNQTCTRAQIVTFLWRSEQSPAAGTVNPFTDVKSDAYYADAVLWAVKEDVTKGTTDTTFSPDTNCTRAQIVTFIWRCMQ